MENFFVLEDAVKELKFEGINVEKIESTLLEMKKELVVNG